MERIRMSRQMRAKQFAPFDALKGLQNALRLKEYELERVQKGEIQEEKAKEISNILLELEKGDVGKVTYFLDGHEKVCEGPLKLIVEEQTLKVGAVNIKLDDVLDIKIKR